MTHLRKTCRIGSPCSILLIDDDPLITSAIQRAAMVYEPGCFNIIVARSLEDAAAKFEAILYDLVIVDLGLPPESMGLSTVLTVQSFVKERAPVAVLTGTDDEELEIRCIEQGAIAYVVKPITNAEHFLRRARGWILKYRRDMQEKEELLHDNALLRQVQEKILESPTQESASLITEVAERLFAMARAIGSRYKGKGHVATN